MIITKYYEASPQGFVEIEFIESTKTALLEKHTILTVMGNRPCKVVSWLNDLGFGYEKREFTVDT